MIDIEYLALLGDKNAQLECTIQGIVLPCPCCGSNSISYQSSEGDYDYGWGGFHCWDCDLEQGYNFKTEEEALLNWNTRTILPIGEWENLNSDKNDPRMKCSICGSIEEPLARHNYCPNCGSRMRREKDL